MPNPNLFVFGSSPTQGRPFTARSRSPVSNSGRTPETPRTDAPNSPQTADEDTPLPSTEVTSDGSAGEDYSVGDQTYRDVPSVSLSPPPSSSRRDTTVASIIHGPEPNKNNSSDDIETSLRSMRLSSPNALSMAEVATAVDAVASGADSQQALLPDPPRPAARDGGPLRPGSRRRRSSSQVALPRHEVASEAPPPDRFHEPSFQVAFTGARGLMSSLRTVLGSGDLHNDPDSTMRRLYSEADRLARFNCPSTRVVGFVGDSGVGKSSLLNALLDYRDLARTSNSGAACTCVATEYIYHDSDDFIIETECFTQDDLRNQLSDLLKSYRHYYLNRHDLEREERIDSEERANVARYTFQAMFLGKIDEEQFLLEEDSSFVTDSEASVLATFLSWARDMAPSENDGRQTASTSKECSQQLMRLTSEGAWPYIQKIKVFCRAHILSKGLILTDLPGLRDLNAARRHVTEQYLRSCDEIFVVCGIGRVTTDASVQAVIELSRQAMLSNVGIICTKSDDIKPEEAKNDVSATLARRIRHMMHAEQQLIGEVRWLEGELKSLDDETEDLLDEEIEEERQLNRRCRTARNTLKTREFELKELIVTTRNDTVSQALLTAYSDKVPGGNLSVFCVSSTDYWDNREQPSTSSTPFLQLSGIINVRRHCVSLVAESQLRTATTYIRDDIPALLGDLQLWVQSGAGTMTLERKLRIRQTLDDIESQINRDLVGPHSAITSSPSSMKRQFIADLYRRHQANSQSAQTWCDDAVQAGIDWSGWHHSSYSAFCRHYGSHSTGKIGQRCWNEEAMEGMVTELTGPFRTFHLSLNATQDDIMELIERVMESAAEQLYDESGELEAHAATLYQTLGYRQHLMTSDVEDAYTKFENELATLKTDALSGIRTSLFGKAMEDSYNQSRLESGSGSDARRKGIINNALRQDTLFDKLMREFKRRFDLLAVETHTEVRSTVCTHLEVVKHTLDIIRSDNAAAEGEENPEFRAAVEAQVGIARGGIERFQAELAVH